MRDTRVCVMADCSNPLNKGKFYCSNTCAAAARSAKRKLKRGKAPPSLVRETIPEEVITLLTDRVGEDAYEVLDEMAVTMLESAIPAPPLAGKTEGNFYYSHFIAGEDRRPSDTLTFRTIDEMLKSGLVQFVLEMKLAALMSIYRSPGSWKVVSPDQELADVVTANMREVLPAAAMSFLRSSLQYGVSFSEKVYEYKTPYELGLSKSRGSSKQYAVSKVPNSVDPTSIDHIRRTPTGDFDGFVQMPIYNLTNFEIVVPRDQALVVPYKMQFRNLWGESYLKPMYPFWFWFEVALRAWARYVERMGTPVAICYAPSRAQVKRPGTTTLVNAMTWGLAVAGQIAKSNATVLPSDLDPQTGQALWKLEYLVAQDRGSTFKEIIEALMRLTVQAGMSADMTFTQPSGGTGSFNIWEGHNSATQLHNELILTDTIAAINKWWLPDFSLYNRGLNGPPIWLETEGLDPAEREHLFKLANIAGNSQAFQDALVMIDWRKLYGLNNVPTLSEGDVERIKKELEKEALRKQREFQKPKEDQKPVAGETKESESSQAASDEERKKAEKLEQIAFMIVNGQYEAMILSDHEMDLLLKARRAGVDVAISTLDNPTQLEQIDVKSGNPFRGPGGRFAPRDKKGDEEEGSDWDKKKKELEDKLAGMKEPGWPEYDSAEAAIADIAKTLRGLGLDIPEDLKLVFADLPFGVGGRWNYEKGVLEVSKDFAESLLSGDPVAMWAAVHEVAHSDQETGMREDNLDDMRLSNDQVQNYVKYFEGQNDLATAIAMSELYGRTMDNKSALDLSNDFSTTEGDLKWLEEEIDPRGYEEGEKITSPYGGGVFKLGYREESQITAGLAIAREEVTGEKAADYITSAHTKGFDFLTYHDELTELFPDRMEEHIHKTGFLGLGKKEKTLPTLEEVQRWLEKDYDIDATQAQIDILE